MLNHSICKQSPEWPMGHQLLSPLHTTRMLYILNKKKFTYIYDRAYMNVSTRWPHSTWRGNTGLFKPSHHLPRIAWRSVCGVLVTTRNTKSFFFFFKTSVQCKKFLIKAKCRILFLVISVNVSDFPTTGKITPTEALSKCYRCFAELTDWRQ